MYPMIIPSARAERAVPRPAFTLIICLDLLDGLEGVESGETVVVEWLPVFTGLAGLRAVVVECGVVF